MGKEEQLEEREVLDSIFPEEVQGERLESLLRTQTHIMQIWQMENSGYRYFSTLQMIQATSQNHLHYFFR